MSNDLKFEDQAKDNDLKITNFVIRCIEIHLAKMLPNTDNEKLTAIAKVAESEMVVCSDISLSKNLKDIIITIEDIKNNDEAINAILKVLAQLSSRIVGAVMLRAHEIISGTFTAETFMQ